MNEEEKTVKVTLNEHVSIAFQAFTLKPGVNHIHQDFLDNAEPIFHLWVKSGRIAVGNEPEPSVEEDPEKVNPNEPPKPFFGR